jgi:hypothetical protein
MCAVMWPIFICVKVFFIVHFYGRFGEIYIFRKDDIVLIKYYHFIWAVHL